MQTPERPLDFHGTSPSDRGSRLDQAHAAVTALREERRRLERLGFEMPLARCHERLRYWEFVAGMLSLPPHEASEAS